MSARFRIEFESYSGNTAGIAALQGFRPFSLVAVDEANPDIRFTFAAYVGDLTPQYERWLKEHGEAFETATVRWSIAQVEERLRYGRVPPTPRRETEKLAVTSAGLEILKSMASEKKCEYQLQSGRDLYCSAAGRTDETAVRTSGLRRLAPTSRPICQRCDLPDTDLICSHLTHPHVLASVTKTDHTRQLVGAFCEINRNEIGQPSKCRGGAGGHRCWTRTVSVRGETVPAMTFSPRELPIALDFLSVIWKEVFGTLLVRLRSVEMTAAIALPCATQEEFRARLGDLNELFKLMDIPEEILPASDQGANNKAETFNRMEACLKAKITDETDRERIVNSIKDLRAMTTVRNKLTHGGSELRAALQRLGVDYPINDHAKAWDRVRSKVTEALTAIRSALQAASA